MLAAGARLGGYLLVERLEDRGSGERWVARSTTGDPVVLTVAPDDGAPSPRPQAEHPNLEPILELGVERGLRFAVTPSFGGVSVADALAAGRARDVWPVPMLAAHVVREVARALVEVHRRASATDVWGRPTPGRILLGHDGAVRLAALARLSGSAEAVSSHSGGEARDVRTLAGVFSELLTHRQPGEVGVTGPADVPEPLRALAARASAEAPGGEPMSAAELLSSLDALLGAYDGRTDVTLLVKMLKRPELPAPTASVPLSAPRSAPPATAALPAAETPPPAHGARRPDPFFDPGRDAPLVDHPRFEVLGRLGSGGMGEVFRVRDRELGEVIALKVIPPGAANDGQPLERLRREVRLARRIASEHVCRIYDIVDLGGGARGITMGLVDGTTLANLMKSGLRADYRRFAAWGADVANGLAAAHELGIIHRDLKPENVMIRRADDRAVILDFGIARPSETEEVDPRLTQQGIIMGTPLYMSPEQLSNRPLEGTSDLYALGLILAELITAEVPRGGNNYNEVLQKRVLEDHHYRVEDSDPAVPHRLRTVINTLLRAAPGDRPQSAAVVAEHLSAYALDNEPSQPLLTVPVPAEELAEKSAGDRRTTFYTFTIGILIAAVLVLGSILAHRRLNRPEVAEAPPESPQGHAIVAIPAHQPVKLAPRDAGAEDAATTEIRVRPSGEKRRGDPIPPPEEM